MGCRVGVSIDKQVLSGMGFKPPVGEDDQRDGAKVLRKMEGDQGEGDNVRNQGGSYECQGGKHIMSVPGVPVLVWRTVPRQVEE